MSVAASLSIGSRAHFLYHSVIMASQPSSSPSSTIVLMHGLLGNAKNFQTLVKLLHKELRGEIDIVVLDLRSHGRTKVLGDLELDYEGMGKDVLHTCKQLNLEKVHLIGHSMGGKVTAAACLAQQSDIDILSATILDISPVEYSQDDEFKDVVHAIDFLETATEGMTEATSKKDMMKSIDQAFDDEAFRMFLGSNLVESEGTLQWKFSVPSISQSRQSVLEWDLEGSFDRPLLLLKGGDSHFVKTSHLETIKQQFPLYNIASIKGAGHWLHAEKPDETATAIGNFLRAATNWHKDNEVMSNVKRLDRLL